MRGPKMSIVRINKVFSILILLIAAICIFQPVLGADGIVSIAYRGSGGSYIGDTVILDGQNTVGNITFLRITGPGLPPEGVPIYDLNGTPGSGNSVEVNPDGTWKIAWYTSNIKAIEKMQTARYYVTAADLTHPEISSTTSMVMKKVEFYATTTPNPATMDDYVSITGSSERGVSYVQIDVTDSSGKIYHTYTSPVSGSGYFNYGFHVDMQPGQYYIRVSNPAIKTPILMDLTIVSPQSLISGTITPGINPVSVATPAQNTVALPQNLPGTGALTIASTPAGSSVYLDSVMIGNTPVDLNNLPSGSHLIELKTPGYQPYSLQVTLTDGARVTLSPNLQKTPPAIPLSPVTVLIGLIITGAIALIWRRP
ncbi:MAG: PEGA domain-containing protein [Methanoregula sp.]